HELGQTEDHRFGPRGHRPAQGRQPDAHATGGRTGQFARRPLFVGFVTDITAQRELESSLREAAERAKQAAPAKTVFLANMSHEIRTPMNSIIGFTELLLKDTLTAEQRGYLNIVRKSSHSLLGLLNNILDTIKLEKAAVNVENIDFSMKELATQIVNSLSLSASAKGLLLSLDYPEEMEEY